MLCGDKDLRYGKLDAEGPASGDNLKRHFIFQTDSNVCSFTDRKGGSCRIKQGNSPHGVPLQTSDEADDKGIGINGDENIGFNEFLKSVQHLNDNWSGARPSATVETMSPIYATRRHNMFFGPQHSPDSGWSGCTVTIEKLTCKGAGCYCFNAAGIYEPNVENCQNKQQQLTIV